MSRVQGLVIPFRGIMPRIASDAFIAPGAVVVGDVEIGSGSSVWYNAVIRGDMTAIRIGRNSNIQDGCVLHVTATTGVEIGDDVLVGHLAMLHGCTLQSGCYIGMKSTVLDGATVETGAMLAAGSLLPPAQDRDIRHALGRQPGDADARAHASADRQLQAVDRSLRRLWPRPRRLAGNGCGVAGTPANTSGSSRDPHSGNPGPMPEHRNAKTPRD